MQILNIQPTQNNNYNTNFKMIKKVELSGLYKKHPEMGRKLIESFKENPDAMEFCRKYDVSVYFDALKDGYNRIQSSLYMFYDNPSIGKIAKLFKFLNSAEDKINIQAYNYDLQRSTNELMDYMLPSGYSSIDGKVTGILSSHVKSVDKEIQQALNKEAAKKAAKLKKADEMAVKEERFQSETEKVNNSIQELINSTK